MSIVHIPFYPSDWLAGTRGMSDAETGVYITLIARIYEMAGPIERDDERLFRLCGCRSKVTFRKSLEYLMSEGKIIEVDGGLFNEKAEKVIKETVEKSSKAKAAAESRWRRKPNKNNASGDADASPKHMPQPCQPEPEPYIKEEPIGSSKKPAPQKRKPAKRSVSIPEGWVPSQANIDHALSKQLTTQEIDDEADRFRDYHLSRGSVFKDWDAAWRTWVGNFIKFGNRRVAGQQGPGGYRQGGTLASIVARRHAGS